MIRAIAILAATLSGVAAAAPPARTFADSVDALVRGVEARPADFAATAEAAWRALCGPGMPPPASPEIGRLRAYYFHRLSREYAAMRRDASPGQSPGLDFRLRDQFAGLRKRYGKTEAELRESPDTLAAMGPGRFRFMAAEALMRKDTLGALRAYRSGWERFGIEDDFLDLHALHAAHGSDTDSLREEGLRRLPGSPATRVSAFNAWIAAKHPASAGKALEISEKAQREWDASPEWKIRHARALMACGRAKEAEPVLLGALDLIDSAQAAADEPARLRKQIFALVETARRAVSAR